MTQAAKTNGPGKPGPRQAPWLKPQNQATSRPDTASKTPGGVPTGEGHSGDFTGIVEAAKNISSQVGTLKAHRTWVDRGMESARQVVLDLTVRFDAFRKWTTDELQQHKDHVAAQIAGIDSGGAVDSGLKARVGLIFDALRESVGGQLPEDVRRQTGTEQVVAGSFGAVIRDLRRRLDYTEFRVNDTIIDIRNQLGSRSERADHKVVGDFISLAVEAAQDVKELKATQVVHQSHIEDYLQVRGQYFGMIGNIRAQIDATAMDWAPDEVFLENRIPSMVVDHLKLVKNDERQVQQIATLQQSVDALKAEVAALKAGQQPVDEAAPEVETVPEPEVGIEVTAGPGIIQGIDFSNPDICWAMSNNMSASVVRRTLAAWAEHRDLFPDGDEGKLSSEVLSDLVDSGVHRSDAGGYLGRFRDLRLLMRATSRHGSSRIQRCIVAPKHRRKAQS